MTNPISAPRTKAVEYFDRHTPITSVAIIHSPMSYVQPCVLELVEEELLAARNSNSHGSSSGVRFSLQQQVTPDGNSFVITLTQDTLVPGDRTKSTDTLIKLCLAPLDEKRTRIRVTLNQLVAAELHCRLLYILRHHYPVSELVGCSWSHAHFLNFESAWLSDGEPQQSVLEAALSPIANIWLTHYVNEMLIWLQARAKQLRIAQLKLDQTKTKMAAKSPGRPRKQPDSLMIAKAIVVDKKQLSEKSRYRTSPGTDFRLQLIDLFYSIDWPTRTNHNAKVKERKRLLKQWEEIKANPAFYPEIIEKVAEIVEQLERTTEWRMRP